MSKTKFVIVGVLMMLFLGALAFPIIKAESQRPVMVAKSKPLTIILLLQCDRPLAVFGINSSGWLNEIDVRGMSTDAINKMSESVDVAHRYLRGVPCVSHTTKRLPQDTPGMLRGAEPLMEISLHVELVPLPRLPSRKDGLDSQGHQPGTPEHPCAPWQTPEFIDLVPGVPIFLTCYPIKGAA